LNYIMEMNNYYHSLWLDMFNNIKNNITGDFFVIVDGYFGDGDENDAIYDVLNLYFSNLYGNDEIL